MNVPSPTFLDHVRHVREVRHADPLRALGAHLRSAGHGADLASSINMTSPQQPIPAPTIEPSGTLVDVLCGQPEQK
jgi:hypothetical protein